VYCPNTLLIWCYSTIMLYSYYSTSCRCALGPAAWCSGRLSSRQSTLNLAKVLAKRSSKNKRSYCCDRKSRAAYAQSFALCQQATIELTCHDHSIIACSRHIYVWCCSSRTSRSWWITQSTQHHRRGRNNTMVDCAR